MPATATVAAKALKCTLVLQPADLADLVVPDGAPRVVLTVRLPDRTVTTEIAAKSVRHAIAAIRENGPDGIACVLQGRLAVGDLLLDAGLTAQIKAPKPQPAEPAAAA
jgi:hypothetical protein